jgi:DNA-binding beta-propeller fold protein YncE
MSVFDTAGNAIASPAPGFPNLNAPDGLAYDPGTGLLYVSNTGNNTITTYDLNGNQVITAGGFPVPSTAGDLEDIYFDYHNREFYVNDAYASQIYVYDENGNSITLPSGSFPNVSQPYGVFPSPSNDIIYVSNDGTDTITAYTPTGQQLSLSGSFSGLQYPDDFTVDPSNGNIYTSEAAMDYSGSCVFSGIAEFDLNGNPITPSGGFKTVNCPDSVTSFSTMGLGAPVILFVANIFGNSVTVYDQNGDDITTQVAPGGFPGLSAPTGLVIVTVPANSSSEVTEARSSRRSTRAPSSRVDNSKIRTDRPLNLLPEFK